MKKNGKSGLSLPRIGANKRDNEVLPLACLPRFVSSICVDGIQEDYARHNLNKTINMNICWAVTSQSLNGFGLSKYLSK